MLSRQDYLVPGILLLIIMSLNNSIQQLLTETSTTAQPERNLDPTENSSSEVEQTLGLHPEVHGLWWRIVRVQLGKEMLIYTLVSAEAYSTVQKSECATKNRCYFFNQPVQDFTFLYLIAAAKIGWFCWGFFQICDATCGDFCAFFFRKTTSISEIAIARIAVMFFW